MSIRLQQVKGQRILRAGRPACVRKESQGVLVIRATANKSLTSVLNGELCCAHCFYVSPVTQATFFFVHVLMYQFAVCLTTLSKTQITGNSDKW